MYLYFCSSTPKQKKRLAYWFTFRVKEVESIISSKAIMKNKDNTIQCRQYISLTMTQLQCDVLCSLLWLTSILFESPSRCFSASASPPMLAVMNFASLRMAVTSSNPSFLIFQFLSDNFSSNASVTLSLQKKQQKYLTWEAIKVLHYNLKAWKLSPAAVQPSIWAYMYCKYSMALSYRQKIIVWKRS